MSRMLMGALLILSSQVYAEKFTLTSPTIKDGQTLSIDQVFNSFGCTGKNRSPALAWSHAPAGTKSFALTVYDPDAPTGSGWWHWVVYNLPATTASLPANAGEISGQNLPAGTVQGRTDYGSAGFGGACPPPGDKPHRYQFTLYALKVEQLTLPADATAAFVGYNILANSLGKAQITAKYGR
ncbi:MAG TPA: YbhB/YbcL family Raf kinase inhibitor-like protein [Cellvibrionaceae bacterium]